MSKMEVEIPLVEFSCVLPNCPRVSPHSKKIQVLMTFSVEFCLYNGNWIPFFPHGGLQRVASVN